jgi:hypothetical protein
MRTNGRSLQCEYGMNDLKRVKQFEDLLDAELAKRPSLAFRGEDCIATAAQIINMAFTEPKRAFMAKALVKGLRVLLPKFIEDKGQREPDIETIVEDLLFASTYYWLRELLYYTYNRPDAVQWTFGEGTVDIKITDPSIPRQFSVQFSSWIRESMKIGVDGQEEKLHALLKGEPEFGSSPKLLEAFAIIEEETERKLKHYFDFKTLDDSLPLGTYTYGDFRRVYRYLVSKALYHRYYAAANAEDGVMPCFLFRRQDLIKEISLNTELNTAVIERVVADMTYSRASKKMQPMYFSIWDCERLDYYVIVPNVLLIEEGFVNMLRIQALKSPVAFQTHLSGPLGDGLTTEVAAMFQKQGFRALTNVKLNHLDPSLPDIDVFVSSFEKTLGFVVFVCETKAPIPPIWAKDQLRAVEPESIAKAFGQIEKLRNFIGTDAGAKFIHDLLPREEREHFKETGWLMPMSFFVITSNNAGMFFESEDATIIDYKTLGSILEQCDGDVSYVQWGLGEFAKIAANAAEVVKDEIDIGGVKVTFDAVSVKSTFAFREHKYKSEGLDEKIFQDFVADGHKPFDTLKWLDEKHAADSKK